jgi:beta-lactamase class A
MISRRHFAGNFALGGLFAIGGGAPRRARAAETIAEAFATIENEVGGRLGVAVQDEHSGARFLHRADERFPMCSTFKMLAGAAVLMRVDAGAEQLDRRLHFSAAELIDNSPVTKGRLADGMTLEEACAAAITLSDNTAGNLLVAALGGPAGVTSFARSLRDTITRLDRIEPEVNESSPGDPRDTTTPAAMLSNMRTLLLGDALSTGSRDRLTAWLVASKTGAARLRAGLPAGWRVGDKTGLGEHGSNNDIAIVWPPQRAPILFAVYLTQTQQPLQVCNSALASVARAVVGAVGG